MRRDGQVNPVPWLCGCGVYAARLQWHIERMQADMDELSGRRGQESALKTGGKASIFAVETFSERGSVVHR